MIVLDKEFFLNKERVNRMCEGIASGGLQDGYKQANAIWVAVDPWDGGIIREADSKKEIIDSLEDYNELNNEAPAFQYVDIELRYEDEVLETEQVYVGES